MFVISGTIFKFSYNKGNSIEKPDININYIEKLELIDCFDIGTIEIENFNKDRFWTYINFFGIPDGLVQGAMTIKVTDTGYKLTSNIFPVGYECTIPVENIEPNMFGFFSEHYSHSCGNIGYFELNSIRVIVDN